jgi:apolipoprotein N-acyltransferase
LNLASQLLLRSRYPLAIVAGLTLAAAFLEIGMAGLAWVAPALILATAHGKRGGDAFRIGYVAGLAHYLASLYWLLLIPVKGYPILGWVALSAYLALYPAVWVWIVSGVTCHMSRVTSEVSSARCQVSGPTWAQRTAWTLGGAALWVALEMIVSRLFSGFPWNLIGTSQYRLLPLIQIASVAGVYGVSFVIVWFSLSIYSAVTAILRQPTQRNAWLGEMILPLAVLVALFVFGLGRLREQAPDGPTLRVTFVQPSIPQTMIWDEKENDNRFRQLLELTTQALTNRTDLLLWPEAAVPKMIRYDEQTFRAVTGLAKSNQVWMIIGCDDAERRLNPANPDEADYFNSSFLISPDGELASLYRKRHLVIFGEYIPLIRWLPFVKWFTPITGGFTEGEKIVPFEMNVGVQALAWPEDTLKRELQRIKTATLICFEDVFPHLVPEYVDDDTDFLVNLTNDGWFGEGAEQWQHAASAVFRCVENGIPLARCCNNGLTCWIDSRGRLREIFRDKAGSVYGAGVMTAQIPVLAPGEKRAATFYNEHGDWFGWGCVVLSIFPLIARCRKSSS